MTVQAQETLAATRSKLYWFLSDFYLSRPDESFRQRLQQQLSAWDATPDTAIDAGLPWLQAGLNQATAERLGIEYTRLFGGIKEGYGLPPPYESLYRESRLMGDTTLAVTRTYAEAGFAAIDAAVGPQDHIGVELKFMALLCHAEFSAWDQDDSVAASVSLERQCDFLDQHLLYWVPAYCQRLQNESTEPFYRGVAMISEQVLSSDREMLAELCQDLAAA